MRRRGFTIGSTWERGLETSIFVGDKYLCVVVKVQAEDAFVVTAYMTDKVKKGNVLWPIER